MQNNNSRKTFASFFGKSTAMLMIYIRTSVFVVVGREEGPFSAPKALEAPMGELGPEPGALLVGVESTKHQGVRTSGHPFILEVFSSSQPEIFGRICPSKTTVSAPS